MSIVNSLFGIGAVMAVEDDVYTNHLTLGSFAEDSRIPLNIGENFWNDFVWIGIERKVGCYMSNPPHVILLEEDLLIPDIDCAFNSFVKRPFFGHVFHGCELESSSAKLLFPWST
jgi:hypothetical protein